MLSFCSLVFFSFAAFLFYCLALLWFFSSALLSVSFRAPFILRFVVYPARAGFHQPSTREQTNRERDFAAQWQGDEEKLRSLNPSARDALAKNLRQALGKTTKSKKKNSGKKNSKASSSVTSEAPPGGAAKTSGAGGGKGFGGSGAGGSGVRGGPAAGEQRETRRTKVRSGMPRRPPLLN